MIFATTFALPFPTEDRRKQKEDSTLSKRVSNGIRKKKKEKSAEKNFSVKAFFLLLFDFH